MIKIFTITILNKRVLMPIGLGPRYNYKDCSFSSEW